MFSLFHVFDEFHFVVYRLFSSFQLKNVEEETSQLLIWTNDIYWFSFIFFFISSLYALYERIFDIIYVTMSMTMRMELRNAFRLAYNRMPVDWPTMRGGVWTMNFWRTTWIEHDDGNRWKEIVCSPKIFFLSGIMMWNDMAIWFAHLEMTCQEIYCAQMFFVEATEKADSQMQSSQLLHTKRD